MYKITLREYDERAEDLVVVAENHEELRAVITLAPEENLKVVEVVELESFITAEEFLGNVSDKKPEGMEFGIIEEDSFEDNWEEDYIGQDL